MKTFESIENLYNQPLMDLVDKAHQVHKENFNPQEIQASQLLSIKTGGCPENCSYCPQSAHYKTEVQKEALMPIEDIKKAALKAKSLGATRFCMGAAWREVKDGSQFDQVLEAVSTVKDVGLEVCCTLGMITESQAHRLKKAGLYAYNHNIDTSEEYYSKIISTRDFNDRLDTIKNVRKAGLTVCTGGILGMGETDKDRVSFIQTLANFSPAPESVTINTLVKFKGTPLENSEDLDPCIIPRVIACVRILIPQAMIRLSAGRLDRTPLEQFICFFAGANSIFYGEKLLTSPNPHTSFDRQMFKSLDLTVKDTAKPSPL